MNRILTIILLLSITTNNFFQPFLVVSDSFGPSNTVSAVLTVKQSFNSWNHVGANNAIPINEDDNWKGNLELGSDEDSYFLQDFFSIEPICISHADNGKKYHFKLLELNATSFEINTPPPEV